MASRKLISSTEIANNMEEYVRGQVTAAPETAEATGCVTDEGAGL